MLLLQVGLLIVELLNLLQQRLKFGELGRNDLLLTLLYSKVIHLDVAFIASSIFLFIASRELSPRHRADLAY